MDSCVADLLRVSRPFVRIVKMIKHKGLALSLEEQSAMLDSAAVIVKQQEEFIAILVEENNRIRGVAIRHVLSLL